MAPRKTHLWRSGDRRTVATFYMAKQAGDTLAVWQFERVRAVGGRILRDVGATEYTCCTEFFYYRGDWAHNNGRYREVRDPAKMIAWLRRNKFRRITDTRRREMVRGILMPTVAA